MQKIVIFFYILLIMMVISCEKNDKVTIISTDVSQDVKVEENEVKLLFASGNKALNRNEYMEALLSYEKAIELDKSNKDLYIEIKDKYLQVDRLDDAYAIIKKALDNNVDVENMNSILQEIKKEFSVIKYTVSIDTDEDYSLPTDETIWINNEEVVTIPITWTNTEIEDKEGVYVYEGVNDQYGRNFKLTLTIHEKILSESEVESIINSAEKALQKLLETLSDEYISKKVNKEVVTFSKSNKYDSKDKVIDYLNDYYTKDAIKEFIKKYTYEEKGEFYIRYGDFGEEGDLSEAYINQLGSEIYVQYSSTIDGELVAMKDYYLMKKDGRWLIDNINF